MQKDSGDRPPANDERELALIQSARRDAERPSLPASRKPVMTGAGAGNLAAPGVAAHSAHAAGVESPTLTIARSGLPPRQTAPGQVAEKSRVEDATPPPSSARSLGLVDHGRFAPGTMLADRYRVVELLGTGGMGEVYRVDDLKLGQSIALKFLTRSLADDPARVEDMYNEVRVARQVSHPNVCRVYDIGEIQGHPFISMEYIDGENLSSLLKRIGRLSQDKSVDITRQLCAGLAAAHERGVLHRDLKPSNIMIDGRGKVRINDFGLAGFSVDLAKSEIRAGTPAYMAPEQFAGTEVSVKSDLYALGLVMYEMLTGRRPFAGHTIDDYAKLHERSSPTQPSSIIDDVDPVIDRLIMRCLEKDPQHRPPSAIAVAAALPGGDPLAAALAAGELPSPEMVAAAGASGAIRPALAAPALLAILVGVLVVAWLNPMMYLFGRVPLEKSPQVLADHARVLLASFGHADKAADATCGFRPESGYLDYISSHDASPRRWDRLSQTPPAGMTFWYRQSPEPLVARDLGGSVTIDDPPPTLPGMACVWLDPKGRLSGLRITARAENVGRPDHRVDRAENRVDWAEVLQSPATSPETQRDETAAPTQQPKHPHPSPESAWRTLFREAGLEISEFRESTVDFVPPVYCDAITAWEGRCAAMPDTPLRVHAGAVGGRPVYFALDWPWTGERATPVLIAGPSRTAIHLARIILTLGSLLGGAWLAWRNMQLARGDRRGALRLAFYVFLTYLLNWLMLADHVADPPREWDLFMKGVGRALFFGAWVWMLYIALEPYVRRFWPDSIVAWSRLLAGRWRDPLIGRDLLIGGLLGVGTQLVAFLMQLVPAWLGFPAARPLPVFTEGLLDLRHMIGVVAWGQVNAFLEPMFAVVIILLFRVIFRHTSGGVVMVVILFTANFIAGRNRVGEPAFYIDIAMIAPIVAAYIYVLMRFGLLAMISGYFFLSLLTFYPFTLDLSGFHGESSLLVLALTFGLATYGFFTALAGRPLIREEWSPA